MSKAKSLPTWKLFAALIIVALIALAYCVAMYLLPPPQ